MKTTFTALLLIHLSLLSMFTTHYKIIVIE